MDSDERRREHHLDFAELKLFHSMAQRPRVRSLLSYIVNLEEQVISGCTVSDENAPEQEDGGYEETMQKKVVPNDIEQLASSKFSIPEQKATGISEKETILLSNEIPTVKLQEIIESKNGQVREEENSSLETHVAERDSERKHKGTVNSGSLKWEEMPKLYDIKIPLIVNSSSCKSTEEPNHGPLQRYSKQLLHERAHPSDANETSSMATVSIENIDTCNQASWAIPDRNDQLEEDCNGNTCETNSGVPPKNFPSRSARRKYLKRRLRREMKTQANANSTDANDESPMEVSASDNNVICNLTIQVMPDRNKQLGNDGNENTCEATSGAHPGKFCSRSARRKYARRQLKKEMKTRELHKRTNCSDADDTPKMEVADICNQPNQVIPDRNEELEEDCHGNTCEPSSVVSTEKFPRKSLRCEYAQRFKKKRNKQGRGYAELQNVQRNGGDTTKNETHHPIYSHRQPLPPTYLNFMQRKEGADALCLERLQQASSPTRVEYESHYLAPASLSYSLGSYERVDKSIYSGVQNLPQSQPYKYNWDNRFTEDARGSVWKPTGNVSVDSSVGTALGPASTWFRHNSYVFTSRSNTS